MASVILERAAAAARVRRGTDVDDDVDEAREDVDEAEEGMVG